MFGLNKDRRYSTDEHVWKCSIRKNSKLVFKKDLIQVLHGKTLQLPMLKFKSWIRHLRNNGWYLQQLQTYTTAKMIFKLNVVQALDVLVNNELPWAEANRHCRDKYNGQLISREDVKNTSLNISGIESFWTHEHGSLSQWTSIIGCYEESSIGMVQDNKMYEDNIFGRCSLRCFGRNSTFYGIKGGSHCICFMNIKGVQVDALYCNSSCQVNGRSSKFLCGGDSHFTVFQEAPRIPAYIQTCPDKVTCSCAATQCQEPQYYAHSCETSQAASCGRGGFKYVRLTDEPVYYNWLTMIETCASGGGNAPPSYLDSLLADSDRQVHCNENSQNPSVIWTNMFRSFLPAAKNEHIQQNGRAMVCSYCIRRGMSHACENYYDTCNSSSSSQYSLQFICSYDENRTHIAGNQSIRFPDENNTLTNPIGALSTREYTKSINDTATESVTKRPFPKRPRRKQNANPAVIGGIAAGVAAVIILVIVILIVGYRRRKKAYNKQVEQMTGSEKSRESKGKQHSASVNSTLNSKTPVDKNNKYIDINEPKDSSLSNKNVVPGDVNENSRKALRNEIIKPTDNLYDHTSTTHNKTRTEERDIMFTGNGNETYDHTNGTPNAVLNSNYYDHMKVRADKENMYDSTNDESRNYGSSEEGDVYNHISARDIHIGETMSSVYYDHCRSAEATEYDHVEHHGRNKGTNENIYDESIS